MALLHIPGVVVVGDTLRIEERERWYTPAHFLGLWEYRLRRERETSAGPVVAHEEPAVVIQAPSAGQLDLFGSAVGL
jgi:hypothetical protein